MVSIDPGEPPGRRDGRSLIGLASRLWSLLDGDPSAVDSLSFTGPRRVLPSVYDVTALATAAVGVANLAVAELLAVRNDGPIPHVTTDTRQACAAFLCELLFEPVGWERPAVWDPIAGDYESADGWIRLHTNYNSHRAAALRTLGLDGGERDTVAAAVATWRGDELEGGVVAEGGCAAVMRSREQWAAHPHGSAVMAEPPVTVRPLPPESARRAPVGSRPLEGMRVLDLTRVIAGPVCTRFLAAHGADVLRIDPPGFDEVPALVPETVAGKRTAFLDLASDAGRARFDELLVEADAVVLGMRPGALDRLGLDDAAMRERNPALVIAALDAYGWRGPWAERRGFDSLVQMSCGIAAAGRAARGTSRPSPLPAQALDHATGFLLAAAVCGALTRRLRIGGASDITAALVGTANLLVELGDPDGLEHGPPSWTDADTEPRATAWGPARSVPIPGRIDGVDAELTIEPGPLGRHRATFSVR